VTRHSFVQTLESGRVVERGFRTDWPNPTLGYVLDAPYLGSRAEGRGFFSWFSRRRESCLVPPFGGEGEDALRLFATEHADPSSELTEISGCARIPGDDAGVLLEDFWLTSGKNCRILELSDFVVEADVATVVWCTLAPLVVAKPVWRTLADQLERLHPRTRRLVPESLDPRSEGLALRVEAGVQLELRGVTRPVDQSTHALDLTEWSRLGYREARLGPRRVLGDEDGTRLVMRVRQGGRTSTFPAASPADG